MNETYEIRVLGSLGPLLRTMFVGMRCELVPRSTTIRARLSDAELDLLLGRLDQLGIELLQLDCPRDEGRARDADRGMVASNGPARFGAQGGSLLPE
jgi:hypothetical protein